MEPREAVSGAPCQLPPAPVSPAPPLLPAQARGSLAPYFTVRAGADRRLLTGAVAGGVCFDIAARSGLATIASTAWVGVAAAAIVLSRRVRGRSSYLLLGAVLVFGLVLTLRSSPWVIVPVTFALAVLLVLGVSLGADGSGPSTTFPALGTRIAIVAGHVIAAGGMLRTAGEPGAGGLARRRAAALARGALLGIPVMLVIGLLLAIADPIFRSWFDLRAVVQHLVLAAIGAWVVLGLARAASARQPSPSLPPSPSLGTVEAAFVLGGLCALYAAFVAAQFVALSAGGRHVLVTHGLTYAQYARSGFFQLLACAAITLLVLLGVRACTRADNLAVTVLSALTIALTIGVVIVAVRRLEFYEAAYGLTMLRLASLVAAVWIGIVFVLLGSTIPGRGLSRRRFPAAVLVSGLLVIGLWGAANPAAVVARTNLHRAEHGHRLDLSQAARLGPDAVPTLVGGLGLLDGSQASALRQAICALSPVKATGTAFNLSRAVASQARTHACGQPAP